MCIRDSYKADKYFDCKKAVLNALGRGSQIVQSLLVTFKPTGIVSKINAGVMFVLNMIDLLNKREEPKKKQDENEKGKKTEEEEDCLLYTSPSPRDLSTSRMPSSA
eukprot:TRINITY_DN3531_c0_g1_i1.p1 TRINITY_DN3531_c0_g1~~TRINITY_DN3531_c0_g1_i1.p1  ORF type:complete len:106 (+),score=30.72 TRINITY_DN3531_c0_g1_i1:75-392(+)